MRTRLIVAFAALVAAAALVTGPGPAESRAPGDDGTMDPSALTAISIPLPVDPSVIPRDEGTSAADAGGSEAGSTFTEPRTLTPPTKRPRAAQPAVRPGVVRKNHWRFDPDISWYGPGFYGNGTACGQRYTRTILGVAHRTLPCGTLVTFRNPKNGRQITVHVIDRGPYVAGRTWDMSRALCAYLDHCYTGSIEWRWGGRGR